MTNSVRLQGGRGSFRLTADWPSREENQANQVDVFDETRAAPAKIGLAGLPGGVTALVVGVKISPDPKAAPLLMMRGAVVDPHWRVNMGQIAVDHEARTVQVPIEVGYLESRPSHLAGPQTFEEVRALKQIWAMPGQWTIELTSDNTPIRRIQLQYSSPF